jgi:ABC-type multidrug transport system permease subunit
MTMTFNSFITLIEKNMKIFFRSRVSSIFIVLLPFLIILLAGYGFNSNNLSGVVVGVHYDNYSETTQNILGKFEEKGFSNKEYESLEHCVNSVKAAENHICVYFFSNNSQENSDKVIFYVDYSRTNLAHTLINIIGEDVSSESLGVGETRVQDLIDMLSNARTNLMNIKRILESSSYSIKNLRDLENEIKDPSSNLQQIIEDLEDFSNASQISSEINSLKYLKENISEDFENLEDLKLKTESLSLEIDLIISEIDRVIETLSLSGLESAVNIVSPINLEMQSIIPKSSKRDFLLPTVLSLISLFGAVLIASTFVLKNKKTKSYFRNFVTPTKDLTFIISTYLTCLIILMMQFILVFLGLYFLFEMNFFKMPIEMVLTLFLSWSSFIFIGMFLGYVFESEETIVFSSVLISSILMFFSNLILPLENISESLFKIVQFNPFVILENSFKKIYLFNLGFELIWQGLIVLLGFFILFGVLTFFLRKITKRRL